MSITTKLCRPLAIASIALAGLGFNGVAAAGGNVSWSVGIGLPVIGAVIGNAPGYYVPPPVYYPPPPVYYQPRPVIYAPPPVYYPPAPRVFYAPPVVYRYPPRVVYAPAPGWYRDDRGREDWHRDGDRHHDRDHDRRGSRHGDERQASR